MEILFGLGFLVVMLLMAANIVAGFVGLVKVIVDVVRGKGIDDNFPEGPGANSGLGGGM